MSRIAELYATGLSCRDIAAIVGCADETVRKTLIRLGIERRAQSFKKPKPVPSWGEFFAERTEKSGKCLLWTGFRDETGYGRVSASFAPGINFAHRLSWFLVHGPFDAARKILHECDTPACVNPDHLWIGSQAENVKDMQAKGRQKSGRPHGALNHNARLTEADVRAMRALRRERKTPYYKLAKQFGVSTMTALRACKGQSWILTQ